MTFRAPAKINLSLEILGRREDGFHELRTLMCPITLCDDLKLELRDSPGIELECSDPALPKGEDNLAWKAADLFLRTCSRAEVRGAHIKLTKRIPSGAGLGGGSSDAAAVLNGLNALAGDPLSEPERIQLGVSLGSDVAFFVPGGSAVCEGRGERLTRSDFSERLPLFLAKPPFGISTPWAYSRWKDSRWLPGADSDPQSFAWGELRNDLERPVFEKYLILAAAKSWLREQPEVCGVLLSGSGSTIFAILRTADGYKTLRTRFLAQFGQDWWTCEAATDPDRDAKNL
jgi:4-diphosphocytidyl-2-C-methyl-D-erythritol kinase